MIDKSDNPKKLTVLTKEYVGYSFMATHTRVTESGLLSLLKEDKVVASFAPMEWITVYNEESFVE